MFLRTPILNILPVTDHGSYHVDELKYLELEKVRLFLLSKSFEYCSAAVETILIFEDCESVDFQRNFFFKHCSGMEWMIITVRIKTPIFRFISELNNVTGPKQKFPLTKYLRTKCLTSERTTRKDHQ